ncbi:MAG: hypothetical protein LIP12_10995 [Clostridiales bacterium]|nr:hypothetical protein [Clostridiales bacterium]
MSASGETGSKRSDIPGETLSGRPDIQGETGSKISTSEGKEKSMENVSGWLIHMLCEISPSLLESEAGIPECDLEKAFAAGKTKEHGMSSRMKMMAMSETAFGTESMAASETASIARSKTGANEEPRRRPHSSNWKLVVAASGLAAACSAAVTGIVVFACMKRSASFN